MSVSLSTLLMITNQVQQLLNISISDIIAQTNDPERKLNQTLKVWDGTIGEARESVIEFMAQVGKLRAQLAEEMRLAQHWELRATQAVRQDNDSLARDCLEQQLIHESNASQLQANVAEQEAVATSLRTSLSRLEQKRTQLEHEIVLLTARHRAGKARDRVERGFDSLTRPESTRDFINAKHKIEDAEARASARAELNQRSLEPRVDELDASIRSDDIEIRLAALKAASHRPPLAPPDTSSDL